MRASLNPLIKLSAPWLLLLPRQSQWACRPTRKLSWFLHRRQDNFIVTGQLAAVYRDSAIWTTLSGRENSRPSTGTLQKPRHRLTRTATNPTTGPLAKIRKAKNYSASRTASNKIYREMIPSTVLPNCTATLNMYFQTLCFGWQFLLPWQFS